MPVSLYAYIVYGDSMIDSVIDSIQSSWIRYGADLAIALHCVMTTVLTMNPINQQLEHLLQAPHSNCFFFNAVLEVFLSKWKNYGTLCCCLGGQTGRSAWILGWCTTNRFCALQSSGLFDVIAVQIIFSYKRSKLINILEMSWQRVAIRTGHLALILFVALSIPNFGTIMDFFGSTTVPFTCVILPVVFGLWLKAQKYNEKMEIWEVPTLKEYASTFLFRRTSTDVSRIWHISWEKNSIIISKIRAAFLDGSRNELSPQLHESLCSPGIVTQICKLRGVTK